MRRLLKTLLLFALIGAARADTPLSAQGQFLPGLVFPWSRPFVQAKPCPYVNPAQCWKQTDAMGVYWAFQDIQSYLGVDGGNIPIPAKGPQATLKTELSGWVNVKSYGAKGDGTTDDTAAFNLAAAVGSRVWVPRGVYIVKSIVLSGNVALVGEDRDATVLRLNPASTSADFVVASGYANSIPIIRTPYRGYDATAWIEGTTDCVLDSEFSGNRSTTPRGCIPYSRNVQVWNLTVDGNYAGLTAAGSNLVGSALSGKYVYGIYFLTAVDSLISNVRVIECTGNGITFDQTQKSRIEQAVTVRNGVNWVVYGTGSVKGDGVNLINGSSDNVVADSRAESNGGGGFEDEGRGGGAAPLPNLYGAFATYSGTNRNARNRWLNLTSRYNSDHNFTFIFTDAAYGENLSAYSATSRDFHILGTSDSVFRGLRSDTAQKDGIWVGPEGFGVAGANVNLTVDAVVQHAKQYGVRVEALLGGKIKAYVRDAGTEFGGSPGDHGVSLPGTGGGGVYGWGGPPAPTLNSATASASSGGALINGTTYYYRVTAIGETAGTGYGETGSSNEIAVTATATGKVDLSWSVVANGTTDYVVYRDTVGGGVGAQRGYIKLNGAWAGSGPITWTDSGAATTAGNVPPHTSSDVDLIVDYDGSIGHQASYGLYAWDAVNLSVHDSVIRNANSHDIWLDGTVSSGLRISNVVATGSTTARGIFALSAASGVISNCDFSGNNTGTNLSGAAGLTVRGCAGYRTTNSGVTGAIATGTAISHNLGYPAGVGLTPVVVTLQALDGTPTAVYPSALGTFTFTVNYTGGGTHAFYWTARAAADP